MTRPVVARVIRYDPETGIFSWPNELQNQWAGQQAGSVYRKGYRYIILEGKRWMAHRLAWFLVTGEVPKNQIDHRNGNKDDNRFINLREALNGENQNNSGLRKDNTSGHKCVSRRKNKWAVLIQLPWDKTQKIRGNFSDLVDAAICANYHIAYGHGEFARLNVIPQGDWSHD